MGSSFENYLHDRRAEIDAHLDAALTPREGLPDELLQAMRYSLLAPGKRLRPLLVLLAHEACGGNGSDPWPAACAVEMVHVYSLIHDDLPAMDDDDLRRGLPTCHKQFSEATAILAGDALLTLAFEVLAESYPGSTAASCCADLARAAGCAGMVGGQMDDLIAERTKEEGGRTDEVAASDIMLHASPFLLRLEALHARKTGALIRSCLRLGTRVAHSRAAEGRVPPDLLGRLDGYGQCLGLAFQITDDLLDVVGEVAAAGKRVGKDAARGKLTYPSLLGVEESRRRAEKLGDKAREHLAPFGAAARRLEHLVDFVLYRDR